MTYCFLDTETGGIGDAYSLLSAYFLATDDQFNDVSDLELFLKPDDGIYHVCGEAMGVNLIDLKTHDKKAITYREGGTRLYQWLQKLTSDGKDKAFLIGHNVKGDRDKVIQHLISRGSWEKFVSHRLRDTQPVAGFLIDCGILPGDLSCSLESLVTHFGIPKDQTQFHTAKYDVQQTKAVYLALREMIINLNNERVLQRYLV